MVSYLILAGILFADLGLLFFAYLFYHFFDPDEKDARAFAKEAAKQKQWLDVVQVKDCEE